MKTIGLILKEARIAKKVSFSNIEEITKIKSSFIEAIEEEKWESLPPFPTVLGFVKSIAGAIDVDEKMAAAVLKRDYPPQKLRVLPKPDVSNKFAWSPKLTFAIGVASVLVILFGYLTFQYIHFISPPRLRVESPKEDQIVNGNSVTVFGSTDVDAKITVNNQPVEVSTDGKFSVSLDVVPETHQIVVQASSRSGKVTTVSRTIKVE